MQTLEEWRDRINRLARDLSRIAKAEDATALRQQRPELAARIQQLLKALREPGATPNAHVEREEKLIGVLAVISSLGDDLAKPKRGPVNNFWATASEAAEVLQSKLLPTIDDIYRLDAPTTIAAMPSTVAPVTIPPIQSAISTSTTPLRDTGKWKVVRKLNPGYQGEVFLVTGPPEFGPGVLKRLPLRRFNDNKARIRFLREIAILRRLNHPCILRVLDGRTSGDDPWLVTQFAPYGSMADHATTLLGDAWRCLRVGRDLATALGAAHSKKIIHRDVKPKNVLFFSLDGVAIGDFGIAHDEDATSVTSDNERVGARGFAPPEWESGHIQPTPAFDVYSLGKVIYYMLSGGKCPPRESHRDAEWDLERILDRQGMHLINRLLDLMVVEKAERRLQAMSDVVREIDRTLSDLFGMRWPRRNTCRLCWRGTYREAGSSLLDREEEISIEQELENRGFGDFYLRLIVCDQCGDLRVLFNDRSELRPGSEWRGVDE